MKKILTMDNNISLIETKKGNYSLMIRCEDGVQRPLHSLYDPEKEADTLVNALDLNGACILVVLGIGIGYHLIKLAERFPETTIIVVESDTSIYDIAMKHGPVLLSENNSLSFLVGLSYEEVLRKITRIQLKNGMSPVSVITLPPAVAAFPTYYKPIIKQLRKMSLVGLGDRLKYPKFKGDISRIAFIDCGYFLSREIRAAIKKAGHKMCAISIGKDEKGSSVISRLIEIIIEFKPDFFLTVNHLGFDEDGALTAFLESIEMPTASWYVDSPDLIVKVHKKNVSRYVSLFLWDKGYMDSARTLGFDDVNYLPLGTDTSVFRPLDSRCRVLNRYRCDVGFVGNSMTGPAREYLLRLDKKIYPVVKRLADIIAVVPGKSIDSAVSRLSQNDRLLIERTSPLERKDIKGASLWQATLDYRLSCIRQLRGRDVRVYGDEGWADLLSPDFRLGGALDYYRELPLFYNACKINFNATSLQMGKSVNQRVFDIPAAGSFIMTDDQESIGEMFEKGKEIVVYRDAEEISSLIDHYLKNNRERKRIAAKGRKRVLGEHTYIHRIRSMIVSMRSRYH